MDRFEDIKLRIKEASDLVALIESYLPLQPRGRLLLALCPFHAEKTPSFTVYPDSQHYHCFGCGKSGDVFTFLMDREGLSFREAMTLLAERAGIPLDGVFGRGRPAARSGPDPLPVLAEVAAKFQTWLHGGQGAPARDYLQARGLLVAAEPWQLGFHPPGALAELAQRRGLPRDILEAAGLLRGSREPFAGRLIFPIADERGRVVAFGGRLLPGAAAAAPDGSKPPKYVNSPESPFFHKRGVLFGLHQAKRAGERRIVVVEGYTDVIACHLAGFSGTVATLGTAFTAEHSRKIERYATAGVVLLFDGDRAGMQAAERAMRELVNSRLPTRIVLLEDAKDPADMLLQQPGEDADLCTERRARFADLLDGAEDALATFFRLLRRRLDFAQAAQFEAAARECAGLLALVDGELRRTALLQSMARHLAVPPQQLARMVRAPQARVAAPASDAPPKPAPQVAAAGTPHERAEIDLLACVIAAPLLLDGVPRDGYACREIGELLGMIGDAAAQGRTETMALQRFLFARCTERAELRAILAAACPRAAAIADPGAFLAELQRGRRRLQGDAAARRLRQQVQAAIAAGDRETADQLTRELVAALREHRPRHPEPGPPPPLPASGRGTTPVAP